ncbi:MAG: PaaX domain-containing protein, C- domain protein [Acidimicrobiales bacterium]
MQVRNTEPVLANYPPLTARSVLASTLLGARPPELPVAYLVHVAGLFGLSENRTRVALSRMVAASEATTDGNGRYRLVGRLLERQHRQDASRLGRTRPWNRQWQVVIVTSAASSAAVRASRRRDLLDARLAELREGTWARPDNIGIELPAQVTADTVRFSGELRGPTDQKELARSLFTTEPWAARARALISELRKLSPHSPQNLAQGFVLSAAVLRHFQADPLLPPELLSGSWPGPQLRAAYDKWDGDYRRSLTKWSTSPDQLS